mmetsp:Transcript_51684/g.77139  ORF Transcript_51684/g.77139 Transcript_51684/m.77139 type:complete len:225 (+) Transcript_51684:16-690(+)
MSTSHFRQPCTNLGMACSRRVNFRYVLVFAAPHALGFARFVVCSLLWHLRATTAHHQSVDGNGDHLCDGENLPIDVVNGGRSETSPTQVTMGGGVPVGLSWLMMTYGHFCYPRTTALVSVSSDPLIEGHPRQGKLNGALICCGAYICGVLLLFCLRWKLESMAPSILSEVKLVESELVCALRSTCDLRSRESTSILFRHLGMMATVSVCYGTCYSVPYDHCDTL